MPFGRDSVNLPAETVVRLAAVKLPVVVEAVVLGTASVLLRVSEIVVLSTGEVLSNTGELIEVERLTVAIVLLTVQVVLEVPLMLATVVALKVGEVLMVLELANGGALARIVVIVVVFKSVVRLFLDAVDVVLSGIIEGESLRWVLFV